MTDLTNHSGLAFRSVLLGCWASRFLGKALPFKQPGRPHSPLQLDLVVVVVSVVVLIAESANARFLKGLRVLRATRPLRVLTRSQSMLMVGWCFGANGVGWVQRVGHVDTKRQCWHPSRLGMRRPSLLRFSAGFPHPDSLAGRNGQRYR